MQACGWSLVAGVGGFLYFSYLPGSLSKVVTKASKDDTSLLSVLPALNFRESALFDPERGLWVFHPVLMSLGMVLLLQGSVFPLTKKFNQLFDEKKIIAKEVAKRRKEDNA